MTTEAKISMNDKKKNGSKQDHLQFLFHRGGKTAISPPSFAGHGHGGRGTAELAGFLAEICMELGWIPQGLNIKSHLFETAI